MSTLLSHSFNRLIQTADSFRNEVNGSLFEWAIDLLVQLIHSFKLLIDSGMKEMALFMNDPMNRWFTRLICSKCGFI